MASHIVGDFGMTIAFGTTSYAPKFRGIRINAGTRNRINTSHLSQSAYDSGVSAYATSRPGGLIRDATIEVDLVHDFGDEPPISKAQETITVTFTDSGTTTDGAFACTGHVMNYSIESGDDTEFTGTLTIAVDSAPSWTDSA